MQETQETWVRFLGQEDPLEQEMATHSSILTWRILHEQRSLVGYSPWGHKELNTTEATEYTYWLGLSFATWRKEIWMEPDAREASK